MEQGRARALVVDDDPEARKLLVGLLEQMGLEVEAVATGRAARGSLKEATWDLVCLDLMLPDLSGYELCELIRGRGVPVVVVSARPLPNDRAQAEERGAKAYLVKPFRPEELEAQVRALLLPREAAFAVARSQAL